MAGMHLLLKRSRLGLAMRAASVDGGLAQSCGIATQRVVATAWAINDEINEMVRGWPQRFAGQEIRDLVTVNGVRVVKGDQQGYGFTEVLTPEALAALERRGVRIKRVF